MGPKKGLGPRTAQAGPSSRLSDPTPHLNNEARNPTPGSIGRFLIFWGKPRNILQGAICRKAGERLLTSTSCRPGKSQLALWGSSPGADQWPHGHPHNSDDAKAAGRGWNTGDLARLHLGALIIGIGSGCILYYRYNKEPPLCCLPLWLLK